MNYVVVIIGVLSVFALLECLASKYPRLQDNIFNIGFLTLWVMVTIKYYYGPDIWAYVKFFDDMPTDLKWVYNNSEKLWYEPGFQLFCAGIKAIGGTYWVMTAVISTLYFWGLWELWKHIDRGKMIALLLLYVLEYNLFMTELRQCLSVAFFLLMIWQLIRFDEAEKQSAKISRLIGVLALAALSILTHRSGVFAVSITLVFYAMHTIEVKPIGYQILFIILFLMLLVPMTIVSNNLINILPLPEGIAKSLLTHFSLGKQIQIIWVIYVMMLLVVEYYLHYAEQTRRRTIEVGALLAVLLIVSFYQYYYLLNRLRSPFMPIFIVYIFSVVYSSLPQMKHVHVPKLLMQCAGILIFAYGAYSMYTIDKSSKALEFDVTKVSTILDLRNKSAQQIKEDRMDCARNWWWYDYKKMMHGENQVDI